LRFFLLGFYLQPNVTLIEVRENVKRMNKFFILEFKSHGEYQCKKYEDETVKIPKLEKVKQEDQYELKLR
jgi:hypothetical protein